MRTFDWWLLVAVLTALGLSTTAGAADRVCTLTLQGGLPDARDLEVYLHVRDTTVDRAFALAPKYNQISYAVDASAVEVQGDTLAGELVVSITSDGYVPPVGCTDVVRCAIDGTIDGEQVMGTFTGSWERTGTPVKTRKKRKAGEAPQGPVELSGAIAGTIATPPSHGPAMRFSLYLGNARAQPRPEPGKKAKSLAAWNLPGYLNFTTMGGHANVSTLRGFGGHSINYFQAEVLRTDLTSTDGRITGTVDALSDRRPYRFTIDGHTVGDRVAGSFTKLVDGKPDEGGRFRGTIEDVSELTPDDALYYLVLDNALDNDKQLILHLPHLAGGFRGGVGFAGKYNHTYHDVESAGLKLHGNKLTGMLDVTVLPDPYKPPDGKPVPCRYDIQAEVIGGTVVGAFGGTFGDEEVAGRVSGELRPRPDIPEPMKIHVKLDNGAAGTKNGPPWHRRCYIGFTAVDGQANEGSFSNNKGGFKGHFESAQVECDGSTFNATIKAVVDESRSVQEGEHTFILKGKVIGREIVGEVETLLKGEPWKKGTAFMGSIRPVDEE